MPNELALLNDVARKLATIATVDDAKDLADRAAALSKFVNASRQGLEAQNKAALIRLSCERRAGELLREIPRAPYDRRNRKGALPTFKGEIERLCITEANAKRWQILAKWPLEDLQALATVCTETERELTATLALATARAYLIDPDYNTDQIRAAEHPPIEPERARRIVALLEQAVELCNPTPDPIRTRLNRMIRQLKGEPVAN